MAKYNRIPGGGSGGTPTPPVPQFALSEDVIVEEVYDSGAVPSVDEGKWFVDNPTDATVYP